MILQNKYSRLSPQEKRKVGASFKRSTKHYLLKRNPSELKLSNLIRLTHDLDISLREIQESLSCEDKKLLIEIIKKEKPSPQS